MGFLSSSIKEERFLISIYKKKIEIFFKSYMEQLKEILSKSVKAITDNMGPPFTEDFLYRLMYFDQQI